MFGSLKRITRNRSGAFAVQFALMAVPLTVCTGLAIDGGRAFLAHYELASALDAAALAAGSTITDGADLNAVARKFVDANFRTPHEGVVNLVLDNSDDDVLKLEGTVRINTYFMPLVGQPYVDVHAESEVRRGGNNVEVALALDITQSMAGSKIAALKVAAQDLIDEVVNVSQSPYFSKVAITPWGTNIHLGATYAPLIRGPITGTTAISGAAWRNGTAKNLATGTGWRTNAGKALATPGITWKNGSAWTITKVTKITSPTPAKIQVTVSGTPSTLANGDFIYLSGLTTPSGNSYTSLNGNIYQVADKSTSSPWTFNLKNVAGTSYITPPSGSTNATAGTTQECFTATCELQVTATAHGFANGDFVNIMGMTMTGSGTDPNNSTTTTYTIGSVATNTFMLPGTNGPTYKSWSSGGTASKCYTASCQYQVTTSTAHGFTTGDFIYITGASTSGTGTAINNTAGVTFTLATVPSTTTFLLPGTGQSYLTWTANGTASECYTASCEVQVTSASHGLANNEWTQINSVAGMTNINSSSVAAWQVKNVSGSNFILTGSIGPNYSAYTSGGTSQCLKDGCAKLRFRDASGSSPITYQIKSVSNCATERVGTAAHTDDLPVAGKWLGRDYPGSGSLVGCVTGNNITPLTSNTTTLTNAINALTVSGSTAGQIGAEWAWYMLSPNWKTLWPAAENRPLDYGTHELAKVAILMTDGAFNTAHCNGVTTEAYAYSSVSNADRIDNTECTAADSPFNLAQQTCTEMKRDGKITVYTVGFEVGSEPGAADFLTACASDSTKVFLAADENALKDAFKKIATSISKLRISK